MKEIIIELYNLSKNADSEIKDKILEKINKVERKSNS